ncbi:protein Wnt-8b isoform X2 [Procambarus clarkii]|uniref:protein Wnt-8b isoform X2 n=1 Tax=Procambarus clarkii TaxID=6728 RepID=UPI00374450E7
MSLCCPWSMTNVLMAGTKGGLPLRASVEAGVQLGVQECRTQFRWERWPCPALHFTTMHMKKPMTRENAFVQAISSAAVTFSIARNCSRGLLEGCSCSRSTADRGRDWGWRGCPESVNYGAHMTRQLLDAVDVGQDHQALVNLHNNEAGRLAVKRSMRQSCKCHGVSGSCTTQTCWLRLVSFTSVGSALKKWYRRALKLKDSNALTAATSSLEETPQSQGMSIPNIDPRRLVYLADSPDYCLPNHTEGWAGTAGRQCSRERGKNVTLEERRSCRRLCRECGRPVTKAVSTVTTSCNCSFRWCCEVQCESCVNSVIKFTCGSARTHTSSITKL